MKTALNDPIIKNTKPSTKTITLSDGGGLFLYIEPNGSKLWRYRYQFAGKRNLLSLGSYPDITLKQARLDRDELKELILQGIDPSESRKKEKATPDGYHPNAFEIVARAWHNEFKSTWSNTTAPYIIRRLEREIFPWLGKTDINAITAPQLLTHIRRIKDRGILETAHRVLGSCGQVFRYGVQNGYCERDITADLRGALPQPKVKHMPSFTEPADVKRLLRSFDTYTGSFPVFCALRLAPLWFVRPSELRTARWADFDLDAGVWAFVVSKTKTEHIVPLSRQAKAILNELHPLTGGGEFVFTINGKTPLSDGTINKAIRRLGFCTKTQFTGHGFRSMARTMLAERLNEQPEAIEHQLAHKVPDTLGRAYNRTKYLAQRTRMMQVWADYLDELKAEAKIIKFRA